MRRWTGSSLSQRDSWYERAHKDNRKLNSLGGLSNKIMSPYAFSEWVNSGEDGLGINMGSLVFDLGYFPRKASDAVQPGQDERHAPSRDSRQALRRIVGCILHDRSWQHSQHQGAHRLALLSSSPVRLDMSQVPSTDSSPCQTHRRSHHHV